MAVGCTIERSGAFLVSVWQERLLQHQVSQPLGADEVVSVTTFTSVNGDIVCQSKDGVVSHFASDPLGSVVLVRDGAGNTVYEAEYDPYGNVQSETGTNPSEFGFVGTLGYVRDSAFALYVRARYLLTNLGRWLSRDPLWPLLTGFVYGGAAPSMWSDKSGLRPSNTWGQDCTFSGPPGSESDPAFWHCRPPRVTPGPPVRIGPGKPWPNIERGIGGIPNYGNFCGLHTGSPQGMPPIDCVDEACMMHDYCLADAEKTEPGQQGCKSKACNEEFVARTILCAIGGGCGWRLNCHLAARLVYGYYGVYYPLANQYPCCTAPSVPSLPPSTLTEMFPPGMPPPGLEIRIGPGRQVVH